LRTYEHEPLAGLTLSSELLQEMLAEARWQSGAGRPTASRPAESDRAPEVARLVVDTRRQPPLVERERELGLVMARLAAAGTGSAGVVVVSGEPGVGKTRLLNEVADRASKNGWQVLVGSAFDSEGMPPYLPFLEPLDHYIRVGPVDALLPRLGEVAGDLALVLPLIARKLPDLPARTLLDPESARYRLFDSLSTFIAAIANASQAGALLCLDDLHWADDATLQLLEHVCRRLPDTRLLILASYRSSDVNPSHPLARTLEHLIRLQVSERIDLGRLGHDGVRLMLAGLGQPDPPPALVAAVYDETDGNPFFVQEVFEYLAEEGRLFDSDGRWRDDFDVGPTEVPASVRLVIGRRLDRLSAECRALLAVAAVLGRTLKYEVPRQCSELPEDALVARLEEAEAARLLMSDEHSHLTFGHELIRQSLLSRLTALRRQRLHLRAAEALEQVYADAVDAHLVEIADHYRLAGVAADPTKVIDYATRAGDRALSVHAYAESAQQWQWALARLGEQRDTRLERGRLALRLGTLLNDTRHAPRDAVRVLDESVTCFEQAGEPLWAASARIELAWALMEPATRDLPRALSELVSAEGVLRGEPDGPALVDLYARLAAVGLFLMLPIQESMSANARAVAMAERLGDKLRVVRNGAWHASRLALVGQITPALDLLEDHWQQAHRLNDRIPGHVGGPCDPASGAE
jgi:hypothetical protein